MEGFIFDGLMFALAVLVAITIFFGINNVISWHRTTKNIVLRTSITIHELQKILNSRCGAKQR